jgi:RnfABCDGE-type electron transport complex B subunit
MSITVIYTVATLSVIGTSAAVILYFVARKFKVYEDPRIDEVEQNLPAANCGGCGYAGCRAFAEACVKANDLSDLDCPVGGNETMNKVAEILGLEAVKKDARVAFIRCNGLAITGQKPTFTMAPQPVPLHRQFTVAKPIASGDVWAMAIATIPATLMP